MWQEAGKARALGRLELQSRSTLEVPVETFPPRSEAHRSLCVSRTRKKNLYQGLFPNVFLRFLFRGYERKPWQAAVFHEVSERGIPSRV